MNPTFWELLIPIILGVGLFLALRECSLIKKSREAEILLHLTRIWDSEDLIEARKAIGEHEKDLAQKLKEFEKKNEQKYFTMIKVGNFFEHVGLLVEKQYLRPDIILELFGGPVEYYYKLYKDYIKEYRSDRKPYYVYGYFERLAKTKLN